MNRNLIALVLILSLLTSGIACSKQTNSVQAEARTPTVAVLKLKKEDLVNKTSVVAKIAPSLEVKVVPKTAGKVAGVYADVGQRVSAGEVLVELDSSDLRLQLEKTQIQVEDAKRTAERKKMLYETGAISRNEYELAQSSLATLLTTLKQNESDLNNSIIRSPISGIVASRNVNIGEFVSTSTAAMVVVDIDTVEVTGNLMEDEVNYVKPGQEVDVLVKAVSATPFKGRVTKISPSADPKDKTYPIWVSIKNQDLSLKPGMFAEIVLETKKLTGVFAVPNEAITERNGGQKVVFVAEGDKAVERKVKIGLSQDGKTVIVEGLNEGETVIITSVQALKDGMNINVQSSAQKEKPKG